MTTAIVGWAHGSQVGGVDFADEPIIELAAPALSSPGRESDGFADEGFVRMIVVASAQPRFPVWPTLSDVCPVSCDIRRT